MDCYTFHWQLIGACGSAVVLCFILFCLLVYNFALNIYQTTNKISLNKTLCVITVMYFIFYIVAHLSLSLSILLPNVCSPPNFLSFPWLLGEASFAMALISYDILMLLRLHFTFKDSAYRSSNSTYYFYFVLFGLHAMSVLVLGYLTNLQRDKYEEMKIISGVISTLMGLVVGLSLIYLFIYKLFQIVLSTSNNDWNVSNNINNWNVTLDANQEHLLNTIVKQSLLGIVGIISRYIVSAMWFIVSLILGKENWNENIELIYHYSFAIGTIIEVYCVYLSFAFTKKCYNMSCYCCHKCCMACSKGKTKRRLTQINMDYQQF
eukprot:518559_1